jgi:flagellar protein FliO/FliZ
VFRFIPDLRFRRMAAACRHMPTIRDIDMRKPIFRATTLSLALAAAPVAIAQSAAAAVDSGPSMLPMLLALALVLALIPASMWLLRRLGAGSNAPGAGMKVVSQLTLGPRERLVVVEAGDRWLLLGVTASSVNRVGTLAKGELPAGTPPAQGFAQLLSAARRHGAR